MKKIKTGVVTLLILMGLIAVPAITYTSAYASVNPQSEACSGTGGTLSSGTCAGNSSQDNLAKLIKTAVNVLLYVLGAIAVLVIIIGGIRYVTSAGDASRVKLAKDTILYAVIGLVIAILAYAIVNFVVTNI